MQNIYHKNSIYISQIELIVKNLDLSLEFYTKSIGFQVLKKEVNSASLTADGINELVILKENPNASENENPNGLYHFALLLPTRKDLGIYLHHFINKQIPISGAADHLVSEAIYLEDPDHNGIEISWDKEDSLWFDEFHDLEMTTLDFDYPGVYYEVKDEDIFTGLPSNTLLGHLHLSVSDLVKETAFYNHLIGFDIMKNDIMNAVFLSSNKYHHHLALNTWQGSKIHHRNGEIGLQSFTIAYPNCDSIHQTIQMLKKEDFVLKETEFGYLTKDYDGNNIYLRLLA